MFFSARFHVLFQDGFVSTRSAGGRNLEFILLQRLERGRPATKRVVLGDPIENVDAAVVEQRRPGDRALGRRRANRATFQGLSPDILDRLKAVAIGAFVFVQRHG